MRKDDEAGFCYEFCTDEKGGKSVSVFPERDCFRDIPSLQNKDTYYIVDLEPFQNCYHPSALSLER